jgi:hypothetical protein
MDNNVRRAMPRWTFCVLHMGSIEFLRVLHCPADKNVSGHDQENGTAGAD